jgi:hypothetical protein
MGRDYIRGRQTGIGDRKPYEKARKDAGISIPDSRFPVSAYMTALSCLALGFGFAVAVGLLVFAGVVIGWSIPHRRRGPRKDH